MSSFETEHQSTPFRDEYIAGAVEGKLKVLDKKDVNIVERDLAMRAKLLALQ